MDTVNNMENRENIVLVGMLGVGKTAVGRMLAEELGYEFLDMDEALEEVCGLRLAEIYSRYGRIRFYAEDRLLLQKQLGKTGLVVAADGALAPEAAQLELWQRLGRIVWLWAEPETILRRMRRKNNRVFLPREATAASVARQQAERQALYEARAEFALSADGSPLEQVVHEIIQRLGMK